MSIFTHTHKKLLLREIKDEKCISKKKKIKNYSVCLIEKYKKIDKLL